MILIILYQILIFSIFVGLGFMIMVSCDTLYGICLLIIEECCSGKIGNFLILEILTQHNLYQMLHFYVNFVEFVLEILGNLHVAL